MVNIDGFFCTKVDTHNNSKFVSLVLRTFDP
jgi:hypothetical protein